MSESALSSSKALRCTDLEHEEINGNDFTGGLIALRTKAELHASLETTLAYIVEIPAKSASSVLRYVKYHMPPNLTKSCLGLLIP